MREMGLSYMKKYDSYCKNLQVLERARAEDLTNEFILSGIIDKFFLQFELGWKVMKELLQYEGNALSRSGSPRDIVKEAYRCFGFIDEEMWLEMLRERNNMAHIYNGTAAEELVRKILNCYIEEFQRMQKEIENCYPEWGK